MKCAKLSTHFYCFMGKNLSLPLMATIRFEFEDSSIPAKTVTGNFLDLSILKDHLQKITMFTSTITVVVFARVLLVTFMCDKGDQFLEEISDKEEDFIDRAINPRFESRLLPANALFLKTPRKSPSLSQIKDGESSATNTKLFTCHFRNLTICPFIGPITKTLPWHFMSALARLLTKVKFTSDSFYGVCFSGFWKFHILKGKKKKAMKATWSKSRLNGCTNGERTTNNHVGIPQNMVGTLQPDARLKSSWYTFLIK